MRGGLRIAALGFGCELCGQLEDLVLVVRGQGLKQCEDVGDVVHFSSLGHPCVFGAGWNYNATARRLATEYLTERRRRDAKISQLLHPTGRSA